MGKTILGKIAFVALSAFLASGGVVSLATAQSARTCSQAASLCNRQCADRAKDGTFHHSGRVDTSCVDGCMSAASECPQTGCFKASGLDLCKLGKS